MRFRTCVLLGAVLGFLVPLGLLAQDERRVSSPDGQMEFRIFVAEQQDRSIIRIAYQVWYGGKALIRTSFLALDIWSQEPMLGEATGLISSHSESRGSYNSLTANYMQNGSLGRLLTVEVRAFNDGVAFRYVIPASTPLRELQIADEATEFALPQPVDPPATLPFVFEQPAGRWVEITEVPLPNFPRMHLILDDENILLTRLALSKSNPGIVYEGTTPLTCPWRVVIVGHTRESLSRSAIPGDLSR
jgi:alpha-glucosidase